MAGKKTENTILDYLKWRGDLSFDEAPFNPVDNLIFSIIVYLDFKGKVGDRENDAQYLSQIAGRLEKSSKKIKAVSMFDQRLMVNFVMEAASTKRFGNVKVMAYDNVFDGKNAIQFAAVTFLLNDATAYVAFRGTDNTIAGWKEDFMMSYQEVPSLKYAEIYLENICTKLKYKKIRVGGHSKGGNLALWAAANVNKRMKNKLINVYTNDAPGFDSSFFESGKYLDIKKRTNMYVASESIIGMLFGQDDDYRIINSFETNFQQHNPFTWEVMGPDFVFLDDRSTYAKKIEKQLANWLDVMDPQERENLTEMVFSVLEAPQVKTLGELGTLNFKNIEMMTRAVMSLDKEDRKKLGQYVKLFFKNKNKE